jgi:hypothetical protein
MKPEVGRLAMRADDDRTQVYGAICQFLEEWAL